MKHHKQHFKHVASVYDHVRNTDTDVIGAIIPSLPGHKRPLDVADIGCGTGKYSEIIAEQLNSNLRLFCCDYSDAMLSECRKSMNQKPASKRFNFCLVSATDLPFVDCCFDAVLTFNAVHHFDLDCFIGGAAHVLRHGGLLAVYTRTSAQNARILWGQHFPAFTEYENRLYTRERLERAVGKVPELKLEYIREFRYERSESVEFLLKRTFHKHYSTFSLYPAEEFNSAREIFAERLARLSTRGIIEHTVENTLVLARKI